MAEDNDKKSAKESAQIFGKQFIEDAKTYNEQLSSTNTLYSEINNEAQELLYSNENVVDSFRKIINASEDLNNENKKSLRSLATLQTNAVKDAATLISNFETDSKKIDKTLSNNNNLIKILSERIGRLQKEGLINEALGLQDLLNDLILSNIGLENFKKIISEIKSIKIFDEFDKIADSIPVLGKLIKNNITVPFKEGAIQAVKEGKIGTDIFAAGLKNIGKSIGLAFQLIALESLFKVNKQITELQKNLGISSAQAQNLRAGFAQSAANANDLFITSAKLQKAFNDFSGELGGAVANSGQILETFANLTGRFGLSNQEAAKLTSILGLQDKNTEQVLDNTIKTINASRSSGKEFLNTREIIKDIASVSFNVIASLGKSPDILAEAATRARELGLDLDKVEKIADSLLNFESSISAELTAELLTGKQLNLERARFLALNNDIEGVMNEINKQGINFTEFTKMNRIAQEALANTLGMGRAEMTEMLFKQEQQELQARANRGELDKQTLAQFKALDAQEKFNLAVEKAKAALSDLVIVFSPILDLLSKLAEWIGGGADQASKLGATMGTVAEGTKEVERSMAKALGYAVALGAAAVAFKLTKAATLGIMQRETGQSMKQAAAAAIKSAFVNPVAALAGLAIAAVVGAGAIAIANKVTGKAKGGPITAGQPYLVGEEGPELIVPGSSGQVINNNVLNSLSSPPSINIQPLIDRLDKLERTLVEYRSIPVVIENNIDGRQLNENTIKGLRKGYLTTPSVYT